MNVISLKNRKKYAFLCVLFCIPLSIMSKQAISDKIILSTYQGIDGQWQNLEYLFVIKPEKELNHFIEQSFSILGIAGAGILLKYFIVDSTNNKQEESNGRIKSIILIASGLAVSKTIYDTFISHAKQEINKKIIFHILNHWDLYRLHFPEQFIAYFDELANQHKLQEDELLTPEFVFEIFELVNHHLEHHFESRYKKELPKSLSHFETFKNSAEVWKNLG
ncbi:hypothetical protein HYV11_03855 [Candidatus Dependentiae bacterium]|nr:hypothetical protein [Candidatus Dependentiae bacterium]